MPAQWSITNWPECDSHVFLSHCAEDRDNLVVPVYEELIRRNWRPWLDTEHYPLARDPLQAHQEALLKSRHVVYFVTPSMLRQGRGWGCLERAFASLIQRQLSYGGDLAHVEL